jgi:hypothetical protein
MQVNGFRRAGWTCGLAVCVLLSGTVVGAQDKAEKPAAVPAAAGGTVSGRVICADTNGPARFGKVLLKSVAASSDEGDDLFNALTKLGDDGKEAKDQKLSPEEEAKLKQIQAESAKMMAALSDKMVSVTVGMDGVYTFTNVKPGTYYVHATVAGYIDPLAAFSSDDLTSKDPAMREKIAAVAKMVTVTGTEAAYADLRVERGAAISGRVLFDDGTPAAGWTVKIVHPVVSTGPLPPAFSAMGLDASDMDLTHMTEMSTTDDTGHYRIAGLETGEYVLQARLVAAALGTSGLNPIATNSTGTGWGAGLTDRWGLRLTVYSGDALRQGDAKKISVRAGDERSGYNLTMPLHALHSVSGRVVAKSDGHGMNSGSVELTAQDAAGKDDDSLHFTASIHGDGTFRFDYVPGPVTYAVKVTQAADSETVSMMNVLGSTMATQKTLRSYGPASAVAIVGDKDAAEVTLTVAEIPAAK